MIKRLFSRTVFSFVFCLELIVTAHASTPSLPFSIAFYYASNHPLDELKAFDLVVADPDSGISPKEYGTGKSELLAYVSLGEADPNRTYTEKMDRSWFIAENKNWGSRVVDTSNPEWQSFFIEQVIAPLWKAGYRGFFIDTVDSYRLSPDKRLYPIMEEGIIKTLLEVRRRFPGVKLVLNRGFELIGKLKGDVYAVAAESLFQGLDPSSKEYVEVRATDREWLLAELKEVQAQGVPVISIDYVPPEKRDLARVTAEKIKSLGIIPWVADRDLAGLGVGAIEVMPRKILALYDGTEGGGDPFFSNLQRFAAMPLNYLGYTLELHDLRSPLPEGIFAGRYAGVVVWPNSDQSGEKQKLKSWVIKHMAEGLRTVFLDRFGFSIDAASLRGFGIELDKYEKIIPPVTIMHMDDRMGFELLPLLHSDTFFPFKLIEGATLLKLRDAGGRTSDAAAITPWGGYILSPNVLTRAFSDQSSWVIDPFRFFKDALRLPDMPVPDTTTENGVRLLFSHVDGDGFESMAEWQGGGLAADELRQKILEKYRIPVTVSVITGVLSPKGLYPSRSVQLEKAARSIFALPWVEAASHSFSHPFLWKPDQPTSETEVETWHNLKIPGYVFNLKAEIPDSIKYINENLMPPGKTARIFLWTGNSVPGEDAIRLAYETGNLNINGGDTTINDSKPSLTRVAPLGISRNGWFQVFAANQNENVYTNLWSNTFYGYRRVLETFRLTDRPRRLKPVDIYYHFYSLTKEASLKALQTVHNWAISQKLFSIHTSEYIDKVLDFNRTVVARDGLKWLVRNNGDLREFRISKGSGFPDLALDNKIAGFSDYNESRYIHIKPGGEARIELSEKPPAIPYLAESGAVLESFERSGRNLELVLKGYTPFRVELGNTSGCMVGEAGGKKTFEGSNITVLELVEGTHTLEITCR